MIMRYRPDEVLVANGLFDFGPAMAAFPRLSGIRQVETREALRERLGGLRVLAVSSLWQDDMLAMAPRLEFIQAVSVGTDFFDLPLLSSRGVRLANAGGANAAAVAEHATALLLTLTRRLHETGESQRAGLWQKPSLRPDEIAGRTCLIIGAGQIGRSLGRILRAFGCLVLGVRRSAGDRTADFDEVHAVADLDGLLGRADVVVLACPLTSETRGIMNRASLARMRPGALLINVARGGCVDEPALIDALSSGHLGGAGLDVFSSEPLPADSPLWRMPEVVITPHVGGDTGSYERRVMEMLNDNLGRLESGATGLRNQII